MTEAQNSTVHDPDDGNRYELAYGGIYLDGSPPNRDQFLFLLYAQLAAACPPQMDLLVASYQIRSSFDPEMRPDVLVVRSWDVAGAKPPGPPLLAVEVLPRNSIGTGLNEKKHTYQRFGVPSYWMIDSREPNLVAFELDRNGQYRTVAQVTGNEPFEATLPFAVRIVLIEPLGPTLSGGFPADMPTATVSPPLATHP